jgi:protein-disulfide isomerase
MTRRIIGALLVLAATAATGLGSRGMAGSAAERAEPFRVKGPPDARVTIVEFSDFQCPACRVAEPPLHQLMSLYEKDTKLIFKDFPLERIHPYARAGAAAAECAGRQGKFWEYHDALYERQQDWTTEEAPKKLEAYAGQLKLDLAAFKACQADPSVQKALDADVQEARDRWVGSTPTFFINGKRFVGARQLQERGTRWIEKILQAKK